ncbi:MAG TPA: cupin domain-containing protein [Candidatus Brocadiia bacterium]|nr:cupin domain-containing protein [Candidatus Brocadiales bacterium]
MKVSNYKDITAETVEEGAMGVKIRWMITEDMGAKNFVMRHFEVATKGFTPLHKHEWEHEVFVLSGEGAVTGGDENKRFKQGDVIFIPGNEMHQFRNTGNEPMTFLCLIPSRDKCNL